MTTPAALGAEVLVDVQNVNSFRYADNLIIFQGNTYSGLCFQLFDRQQQLGYFSDPFNQARDPIYLRYMPDPTKTPGLTLTFNDLNSANVITCIASQPYPTDPSIWSINLSASQTAVMSGGNINGAYSENGIITNFIIINGLVVYPSNPAQCG